MSKSKKAQTQTGPAALKAIFADAGRKAEADVVAMSPDPNLARDGIKPGEWPGAPHDAMPPKCPVTVVGRDSEGKVYVITATGHMRRVEKWDTPTLTDMFAPLVNEALWAWPAKGEVKFTDKDGVEQKKTVVKRLERDKAITCLIQEAARKPDFDPHTQHRGRGGWQDSQGRFIWHSGGWLWTSAGSTGRLESSRPAQHDGFLYTRQSRTIEPWQSPVTAEESPARRILADLKTWNWQRRYLDPLLVMGWIVTALMSGALKVRPIIFTTGGAGVGKSTLVEVLRSALEGAVITTVNTTAAGIYQRAKQDSLPFLVDELESKAGSTRSESVIELSRVAYTGGDISRGGQDHEATTFTARNSFGFFAINPPPMGTQDKSRMAVLNLAQLDRPNGIGRKPELSGDTDGRMILRQIMDGWRDFQDRLLPNYWAALAPHGLDARAIDTFGTLLAACELAVGPEAMEEAGLPVTDEIRLGEIVGAATAVERTENLDNWHACLDHLLQSSIDSWREGIKPTVGGVCAQMRSGELDVKFARERLQLVGLGAIDKGKNAHAPDLGACLAIPANGPMLMRIYGDTDWHKGVWYSALKQAPKGVIVSSLGNGQKVKINGSLKHCLLVDLDAFDLFAAKAE